VPHKCHVTLSCGYTAFNFTASAIVGLKELWNDTRINQVVNVEWIWVIKKWKAEIDGK